jgi:lysophospholipase L1-like esterase
MRLKVILLATAAAALLAGCVTEHKARVERQFGESVVFIGDEPAALAHPPLRDQSIRGRNTYLQEQGTIEFVEGRDFIVDYAAATLRRTPDSRLPDFRKNMLYAQEQFDHSKYPGFGNSGYFAFVDYAFVSTRTWPEQASQANLLSSTRARLQAGEPVKIVAFGDSITAGGDASNPKLIFWQRWADGLQHKYPRARITALNGATGGDTTIQGLQRLQAKVLQEKPDLVLLGFGMNDHNIGSVPIPQFEQNLKTIIARIRAETSAELILFSTFPPNPKWKFGSHHMADYAAATQRAAAETSCAYADVFKNWEIIASRKKPEDLLGNNINHPNDFGHWIYVRVFEELGL